MTKKSITYKAEHRLDSNWIEAYEDLNTMLYAIQIN
jgi:hypothetical protein